MQRVTGLLRLAGAALAIALIAGSAMAQSVDQQTADQAVAEPAATPEEEPDFSLLNDETPMAPPRAAPAPRAIANAPATTAKRSDKADGSIAGTVGQRLPLAWDANVGVDFLAPTTVAPGPGPQDRGTGWATVTVPAAEVGLDQVGLDKATIDARVDPADDQGKLSTSLSRSVPVGGGLSVTLQNGYSITQTLANPNGTPAAGTTPRVYTGDGAIRVELPTATALSAGARMSSTDERMLRSLSAEQKLFDTPLSITGSISQRPTGDTDKSIKAGFKRTW
jgi:hypothetical protein